MVSRFLENIKNVPILQIYVSNEQGLEGSSYFGVVVEPDVEDAFITSLMYESIANGNFTKVPIMLGICSEESLYRAECIIVCLIG